MPKVIIMKGLPGSGKSTVAKEIVSSQPKGLWKRINKDDLRNMLDAGRWSARTEDMIIEMRDLLLKTFIGKGLNVIIDDTNFHPKHERRIREIVNSLDKSYEIEVMMINTPVAECIRRDSMRSGSARVGKDVILRMYKQYINDGQDIGEVMVPEPFVRYQEQDEYLPKAVIFDIDGTMALMHNRGPFDWARVGEDIIHKPVIDLFSIMQDYAEIKHDFEIICVSGRDASCREETEKWLMHQTGFMGVSGDKLFMRPAGDNRPDTEIKKEIYENEIKNKYNVLFVLDDRQKIVDMYRMELRIPCFQVWYGNF